MDLSKWNPFKFRRKKETTEADAHSSAASDPPRTTRADVQPALAPFVDPWRAMHRMLAEPFFPFDRRGELGAWFGDFSDDFFTPRVDIVDTGTAIEVTAELPGMTREDVDVKVQSGSLVLSGKKSNVRESHEEGCYRTERTYGAFRRVVPVPVDIRTDDATASFKDGVLVVSLPKSPTDAPTRSVRIGS